MSMTKDQVLKTAHLARLNLAEDEAQKTAAVFNKILDSFQNLSEIETDTVEPLLTPHPVVLNLREDIIKPDLTTEEALQNAPQKTGHLFTVPPAV
jgi:aspartyl-tRNA(Asn)/glutamyl-tRNA(Gln) amidotransferase subunit C